VMERTGGTAPEGDTVGRRSQHPADAKLPEQGMFVQELTEQEHEWQEGEVAELESLLTCTAQIGPIFFTEVFVALEKKKFPEGGAPHGIVESFTEVFGEPGGVDYVHPSCRPFSDGVVWLETRSTMAFGGTPLRGHARCSVDCGAAVGRVGRRWTLPLKDYRIFVCAVFKTQSGGNVSIWFTARGAHYQSPTGGQPVS
jgi:hypothetical protein